MTMRIFDRILLTVVLGAVVFNLVVSWDTLKTEREKDRRRYRDFVGIMKTFTSAQVATLRAVADNEERMLEICNAVGATYCPSITTVIPVEPEILGDE